MQEFWKRKCKNFERLSARIPAGCGHANCKIRARIFCWNSCRISYKNLAIQDKFLQDYCQNLAGVLSEKCKNSARI